MPLVSKRWEPWMTLGLRHLSDRLAIGGTVVQTCTAVAVVGIVSPI